jgi:hypothetical protein
MSRWQKAEFTVIVTRKDIDLFVKAFEKFQADEDHERAYIELFLWLTNNPHVLMGKDFVEYVPIYPGSPYVKPWIDRAYLSNDIEKYQRPLYQNKNGQWLLLSEFYAHILLPVKT